MELDYRILCLELFGTDDVEKLRNIAARSNQNNNRNAGRKRKFTDMDVHEMKRLDRKSVV